MQETCAVGVPATGGIDHRLGLHGRHIVSPATGPEARSFAAPRHHDAIERAQGWFRRFGGWLLTFGYFIPGVRHVTAIAAGSGCFKYPMFVAYAYPGGVLWCAVFIGLGYFAGDRWAEVAHAARTHLARAALVTAVAVATYAAVRVAAERRRT